MVIIQGSSRTNGDTKFFVQELSMLCPATIIDLKDYSIGHYDYEHNNSNDDFLPLIKRLLQYNTWIIASPVYWYSVSGLMKVFLDRISDLIQIQKNLGRQLRGKNLGVISVSDSDDVHDCFYEPLLLSAEYLEMVTVHHWE